MLFKYSSAGVEVILVGDSLGMVIQGHDSTLPVTMNDLIYHLKNVSRGNINSHLMADMPFMSYSTKDKALTNAALLMQNGAHSIKLEGGRWICDLTSTLAERGIPVCAHMGLTPQSINRIGTFIFILNFNSSFSKSNFLLPHHDDITIYIILITDIA